jgi:hypothetical protein
VIDQTIVENFDAVKRLNKEIQSILKDKTKKDNKKEVDDALKRLYNEIQKIKIVNKKYESNGDNLNLSDKSRKKCKYFNSVDKLLHTNRIKRKQYVHL